MGIAAGLFRGRTRSGAAHPKTACPSLPNARTSGHGLGPPLRQRTLRRAQRPRQRARHDRGARRDLRLQDLPFGPSLLLAEGRRGEGRLRPLRLSGPLDQGAAPRWLKRGDEGQGRFLRQERQALPHRRLAQARRRRGLVQEVHRTAREAEGRRALRGRAQAPAPGIPEDGGVRDFGDRLGLA